MRGGWLHEGACSVEETPAFFEGLGWCDDDDDGGSPSAATGEVKLEMFADTAILDRVPADSDNFRYIRERVWIAKFAKFRKTNRRGVQRRTTSRIFKLF